MDLQNRNGMKYSLASTQINQRQVDPLVSVSRRPTPLTPDDALKLLCNSSKCSEDSKSKNEGDLARSIDRVSNNCAEDTGSKGEGDSARSTDHVSNNCAEDTGSKGEGYSARPTESSGLIIAAEAPCSHTVEKNVEQTSVVTAQTLPIIVEYPEIHVSNLEKSCNAILQNSPNSPMSEVMNSLNDLECHFKWINEPEKIDYSRLNNLKDKMISWYEESKDVLLLSFCQIITQQLLLACYNGLLGHFSDALLHLDKASKIIENAEEESNEHKDVFRYVMWADKAHVLSSTASKSEDSIVQERYLSEAHEYVSQLHTLDISKPHCVAAMSALKGHLANQLGKTENVVELFQKAVSLNPKCYDWQRNLYTSLRRRRREIDCHIQPSKDEIDACTLAFEIQPSSSWSLISMAQLYEERLKTDKKLTTEEKEEMSSKVIYNLQSAREVNPYCITANIRLAEAYSSNHIIVNFSNNSNIKMSEELFKYCEDTWPNNSEILHKVGKFYQGVCRDTATAKRYFKRALEADGLNYPCLMDYIRALAGDDTVEGLLTLMDTYIPMLEHKKVFSGKLIILKGLLLWNCHKTEEAIFCWSSVFEIASSLGLLEYLEQVLKGRQNFMFRRFIKNEVDKDDLTFQVGGLIENRGDLSENVALNIQKFQDFLSSNVGLKTSNKFFDKNWDKENRSVRENTRYQYPSESDQSSNWRSTSNKGKDQEVVSARWDNFRRDGENTRDNYRCSNSSADSKETRGMFSDQRHNQTYRRGYSKETDTEHSQRYKTRGNSNDCERGRNYGRGADSDNWRN